MSTQKPTMRCRRCGTAIRNNRPACPSCGSESFCEVGDGATAAAAAAAEVPVGETMVAPQTEAPPEAAKQICPMCMSSVAAEQMVEHEGQMLCASCHEHMSQQGG